MAETDRCLKLCDAEIELARKFGPHHIPIIAGLASDIRNRK